MLAKVQLSCKVSRGLLMSTHTLILALLESNYGVSIGRNLRGAEGNQPVENIPCNIPL